MNFSIRASLLVVALGVPALAAATPITLDEALAEAERGNPDVALSSSQVALAAVDVYGAWSGVLPRLDLSAGFGHDFYASPTLASSNLAALLSGALTTDTADYTLGLTLQLPLFDGARSWNTIRRARVTAASAGRSLDEAKLGVAFSVTRQFYEVVKAGERLRVRVATAERSEEFVRRAEALFEAGRGSRADVLAARGNLGADRIAVEQGQAQLDQGRADLAALLGRDTSAGLDVVTPAPLTTPGGEDDAEGALPDGAALLARARRTRPLLAVQAENVRGAELDETIAGGAWFPVVSAQGTYTRASTSLTGSYGVYGDPSHAYAATVGLVVQWNLFAGRQTVAAQQRARVATGRARTQARQAEIQVAAEIARARASLVAARRTAVLAAENVGHARQGLAVARERLQAGAASQLEVRDANLKLTQAELDLVDARIDRIVARADLARAVGAAL